VARVKIKLELVL